MTLVTAGRLVSAGIPSTHFSHVFIDEAGHAMEPESCVALAGEISNNIIAFFLHKCLIINILPFLQIDLLFTLIYRIT